MNKKTAVVIFAAAAACALLSALIFPSGARAQERAPVSDIRDATVYTVNESVTDAYGVELAGKVKTHVALRGWFKWAGAPEYAAFAWVVPEMHKKGILFSGGVTVSAIYKNENGLTDERFNDLATRDAAGDLYFAFGNPATNYFHGAIDNPAYLDYVLSFAYSQIDNGIDAIFMDEVHGAYMPGEGYDDYAMVGFRDYLLKKYVGGAGWAADDPRWTGKFNIPLDDPAVCPDGTMRTFSYRDYLKRAGFAKAPFTSGNPLADEWGFVSHLAPADISLNYASERGDRAWKYLADKIREYAAGKGRKVFITANGNNRYVDFQIDGLWYEWIIRDEKTGATVPHCPPFEACGFKAAAEGRMDGSLSLMMKWKTVIDHGRILAGPGVPVVFFHDWGPPGIPFVTLSTEDKINWIRLYGAEIYSAGGFFAFPVSGPTGDASKTGILDEIIRQAGFFNDYGDLYRNVTETDIFGGGVKVSAPDVVTSVAVQQQPRRKIVHLINHNYAGGKIIAQKDIIVAVPLKKPPRAVRIVSPDFAEIAAPDFTHARGALKVKIPLIEAYAVISIDL